MIVRPVGRHRDPAPLTAGPAYLRATYTSAPYYSNWFPVTLGADVSATVPFIELQTRSIPKPLHGEKPLPKDALVTVISRWPKFLEWGQTILVAAGVNPDAINVCDARKPGWKKGLVASTLIIADSRIAGQLPAGFNARVFRLIADASIDELKEFIKSLN